MTYTRRHSYRTLMVGCTIVCLLLSSTLRRSRGDEKLDSVVTLLSLIIDADEDSARSCLSVISRQTQTGELTDVQVKQLRDKLDGLLTPIVANTQHPLRFDAALVAASWKSKPALACVGEVASDGKQPDAKRVAALQTLVAARETSVLSEVRDVLADDSASMMLRSGALAALGTSSWDEVGSLVLDVYTNLAADVQPRAIELLTQRPTWSLALMQAIADGRVNRDSVNANQIRRLQASDDPQLAKAVSQSWGTVRTERNPARERVVAEMKSMLSQHHGDAVRGQAVFQKVCGQCHTMHGQGQKVGPDITGNGRASFDQLLSNVFDPSLVIGAAYQARTVITDEGRILSGLLTEDSPQRIVLRMQGGKQEVIPRDAIEAISVSKLSLMPEGLEKQLKTQELADLFSFITLDKPPTDPTARRIPGSPNF